MKKTVYISVLILSLLVVLCATQAFAASPTPSATPKTTASPSPTSTTKPATPSATQDETINKEIIDRVKKTATATEILKRRAFVGQVTHVTTESISIETPNGEVTIKTSDKTSILMMPRLQPVQLSEVEINGFVIAMGYVDGDDVMDARRVLISPTPLFPVPKKLVIGTLTSIKSTQLVLETITKDVATVAIGSKTSYGDAAGEDIKRTDLKTSDAVLAIIPETGIATPSATVVRKLK
jgi:hypothetical protein